MKSFRKNPVKPKEDPKRIDNIEFLEQKITDNMKDFITKAVMSIRDEWRKELQDLRKEFGEKGVSAIHEDQDLSSNVQATNNKAPVIDQATIQRATEGLDKLIGNIPVKTEQAGLDLSQVGEGLGQMNKLVGLVDLIKALKGLDSSNVQSIGGQSMNTFIYRQYLATENMKDQVFNAVMKQVLKNSGMAEEEIKVIGDLNSKLMGTDILKKVVNPKPQGDPAT